MVAQNLYVLQVLLSKTKVPNYWALGLSGCCRLLERRNGKDRKEKPLSSAAGLGLGVGNEGMEGKMEDATPCGFRV